MTGQITKVGHLHAFECTGVVSSSCRISSHSSSTPTYFRGHSRLCAERPRSMALSIGICWTSALSRSRCTHSCKIVSAVRVLGFRSGYIYHCSTLEHTATKLSNVNYFFKRAYLSHHRRIGEAYSTDIICVRGYRTHDDFLPLAKLIGKRTIGSAENDVRKLIRGQGSPDRIP